jgi:hypothetical protein
MKRFDKRNIEIPGASLIKPLITNNAKKHLDFHLIYFLY